jgi:UDP-N-acetylglucosamine--N-acetylmuramyl-(pentapeptide) pyrophosphoryl-undecaprenol N-acetylglucosamine transferase
VHQTGERDLADARAAYARAGVAVRAEAFLDPVADEMKAADVVVGRAGATTLAELAAAGTPAVLVPLPTAADDHQRRNAEAVERAGAARLLLQAELTPARLVDEVAGLAADPVRLTGMSEAMRTLARPDAAAAIADRVLALAGGAGTVPAGGRGVSS